MTPKRKPTARAWKLRRDLSALAERGVNGEKVNAQARLAELIERYDFSQPDLRDIFAGVFTKAPYSVPVADVAEMDIASAVKWAIEARTGISCRFKGQTLMAEATPGTAKTLAGIVSTVAPAFLRLWKVYESAGGLHGDRICFISGLYDGMMNEERPPGQPLPARGMTPRTKRRGKCPPPGPGLALHPYSLAVRYGRQIRFSVPVAEVERELKDRLTGQIEDQTP